MRDLEYRYVLNYNDKFIFISIINTYEADYIDNFWIDHYEVFIVMSLCIDFCYSNNRSKTTSKQGCLFNIKSIYT